MLIHCQFRYSPTTPPRLNFSPYWKERQESAQKKDIYGKEKAKETKRTRQTDGNIIDDWHTAKFEI